MIASSFYLSISLVRNQACIYKVHDWFMVEHFTILKKQAIENDVFLGFKEIII